MKRPALTAEHCLYVIAFALALGVRLLHLGTAPLSDYEAGWALQALNLVHGKAIVLGTQPLYALFTSLAFALLGSENGLARLLPALAGSALVFAPFLWSRGYGRFRVPALIAAFGLALDPGQVAASRLAGGPAPALAFTLLAFGFAFCQSAVWTGIFGGLSLLSGVPLIPGLIGLAATWGASKWLENHKIIPPIEEGDAQSTQTRFTVGFLGKAAIFGGATILLAGTLFLFVPQGIAALADTFTAYLRGWARPSGVLLGRSMGALVLYQPLALVFGIIGAVRGWRMREPVSMRLSLWVIFSLALALAYPARQVLDLVWMLVPLWVLAAWEFQHHFPVVGTKDDSIWPALVYALGVIVLLVVAWLGLVAGNASLVLLALAMLLSVAVMVAMWSLKVMRHGLVWGVSAVLVVSMFGSTSGVALVHPNGAQELWSISPATSEANLLLETLEDLSQWKTGERQSLDVTVTINSNALRWLLRDFHSVQFSPEFTGAGVTADNAPSAMITLQTQAVPSLPVLYRGQDFILYVFPGWKQVLPENWVRWLVYREAPVVQTQVILWARTDLFPGGILEKATTPSGGGISPNPPSP